MVRSVVANLDAATTHELANPLLEVIAHLELLDRTQQLDACGRMHLAAALAAVDEIKKKSTGWGG